MTDEQSKQGKELPEMMTTSEVAERLGVKPQRVRILIKEGRLEGEKRGRDWFITRDSVLNFTRYAPYERIKSEDNSN